MTTGEPATAIALSFEDIANAAFPPADPMLIHTASSSPILCAGHLGQLAALRGVGKTLYSRTWALVMASGGSALGYHAPKPRRVLYLDGEMAQEDIKARDRELARVLDLPNPPDLFTIAADWQADPLPRIDTEEGQAFIAPYVEWAEVIILDNRSCLFDSAGEKDPEAWEPAQRWIMQQRRDKKALMMVHHASRQGNARGISKPEDPLNLMMELSHPKDYEREQGARFEVTFTKHRNIPGGAAVRPYVARLLPTGWIIEGALTKPEQRVLDKVRFAWDNGEPYVSKTEAVGKAGGKRADNMTAWDALIDKGLILNAIHAGRKAFKAA